MSVSDSVWALDPVCGQKYPPMAPLGWDRPRRPQAHSPKNTAALPQLPLIYSLALPRQRGRKSPGDGSVFRGTQVVWQNGTEYEYSQVWDIQIFRREPGDKTSLWHWETIQSVVWRGRKILKAIKLSQQSDWWHCGWRCLITIVTSHTPTLLSPPSNESESEVQSEKVCV